MKEGTLPLYCQVPHRVWLMTFRMEGKVTPHCCCPTGVHWGCLVTGDQLSTQTPTWSPLTSWRWDHYHPPVIQVPAQAFYSLVPTRLSLILPWEWHGEDVEVSCDSRPHLCQWKWVRGCRLVIYFAVGKPLYFISFLFYLTTPFLVHWLQWTDCCWAFFSYCVHWNFWVAGFSSSKCGISETKGKPRELTACLCYSCHNKILDYVV